MTTSRPLRPRRRTRSPSNMIAPNDHNNETNTLADLGLATLVPDAELNEGDQVRAPA